MGWLLGNKFTTQKQMDDDWEPALFKPWAAEMALIVDEAVAGTMRQSMPEEEKKVGDVNGR